MADEEEVLAANEAFYAAFAAADPAAMDALWSRQAPVACIHPGWGALTGREEVIESWRRIFRTAPPDIVCHGARAFLLGDSAFVLCLEIMPEGVLIATNVFVREAGGWRMVHHQAGPTAERPNIIASAPTGSRH
ncbi:MAG: hypothetical protein BroJett029_02630 [Alphaproteobacteria bacterium]|nr:MAG: hypothetical protein BroJett029_02630 [Alphaproteobacteria bacterium]